MKCTSLKDPRLYISIFALISSGTALAGVITIPWSVDLNLRSNATPGVPPFNGSYTALDFYPPVGPERIGLNLVSEHQHDYTIHLPMNITIAAPDQASPGQTVFFQSSAALSGAPSFSTQGKVDFNTDIFGKSSSSYYRKSLGAPGLLDTVSYGGVSLTVAGQRSYTDTDLSADAKLTRTVWKKDPFGNTLKMPRATQFEGYQLQTLGDMDAWEGGLDLLHFAGNFIPAVGLVAAIVDVSVGAQLDIVEKTSLTTQFVTGYYTDDSGLTYDNFLINGAESKGYITIPDTLAVGSSYGIQMTALGIGMSTIFDYFLQGNIDIDLELLSRLWSVDIAEVPIGDAFLVDTWVDRWQHVEFLNSFLDDADFLAASLSFDIVSVAGIQDPGKIPPDLGSAWDDPDQTQQQRSDSPWLPPTASATVSAVPEPSTGLLFAIALAGLLKPARRRQSN